MEQDGVACLMVSRYLLILLGYYLASLLSTDSHLDEGPVDIALLDEPAVIPGGYNGRLIHQVFQVSSCEA